MNSKEKEEKNMKSHPFYTHWFLSSSFFFCCFVSIPYIKKTTKEQEKKCTTRTGYNSTLKVDVLKVSSNDS